MLAKMVSEYAYSVNQEKGRYNIGNVGQTMVSTSMLTHFESRYTLKGRYNIGNVGKTMVSTSMLTLFESRYTLKGRYNIGNVGKTMVSTSMLTLFESIYTLKGRYNIGNVGQTMVSTSMLESRYTYKKPTFESFSSIRIHIFLRKTLGAKRSRLAAFCQYVYFFVISLK